MARGDATLQRLIDRCASTTKAHYFAQNKLNDYCEKRYGAAPSDIDCDEIIDALLGGCGVGNRMTVAQFDAAMREALRDREPNNDE